MKGCSVDDSDKLCRCRHRNSKEPISKLPTPRAPSPQNALTPMFLEPRTTLQASSICRLLPRHPLNCIHSTNQPASNTPCQLHHHHHHQLQSNMARQRGGSAPRRPTAAPAARPATTAPAPANARHSSTAAAPPSTHQPPMQQQAQAPTPQGPGLFGQMASTAA